MTEKEPDTKEHFVRFKEFYLKSSQRYEANQYSNFALFEDNFCFLALLTTADEHSLAKALKGSFLDTGIELTSLTTKWMRVIRVIPRPDLPHVFHLTYINIQRKVLPYPEMIMHSWISNFRVGNSTWLYHANNLFL